MNFTSNDNPVLVAPRPVRLTTPFPTRAHPIRLVAAQEATVQDDLKLAGLFPDSASDKDLGSPRSSPRAALPSEALEEFLSILRPSMFPPRSPVHHHVRKAPSLPTFQHDRSYSFKGRLLNLEETSETPRAFAQSPDSSENNEGSVEFELVDDEAQRIRWFTSSVLSSPISRNNTRNPFQRHASYHISLTPSPTVRISPSPSMHIPLSPAAIPLPLPTPDEMADMP
ncbi:hypothetical protein BDZ89DRAFT_1057708 [Hymenopellis radicata]|nr:hypothetical protein BDZ89DRAFT_1057708 [Hymenopellis radicata]